MYAYQVALTEALKGLNFVNGLLQPSFGHILNVPGTVQRCCRMTSPPAKALAFQRLLFGSHGSDEDEHVDEQGGEEVDNSQEDLPKRYVFSCSKKTKKTAVFPAMSDPVDIELMEGIIAEHMRLLGSASTIVDSCAVERVRPVAVRHAPCHSTADCQQEVGLWGGVGEAHADSAQLCLVHSLRALGLQVVTHQRGPFRALCEGNEMIAAFHKHLVHQSPTDVTDGKYVVWTPADFESTGVGHFLATFVRGTQCTLHDEERVTTRTLSELLSDGSLRWYRLVDVLPGDVQRAIEQRHLAALSHRRTRMLRHRSRSPPVHLSPDQQQFWRANYQRAMAIQSASLITPRPPAQSQEYSVPPEPQDFSQPLPELPDMVWLRTLNEHPRDRKLSFDAPTHIYTWNGQRTLGSVTGLVHAFCEEFQPLRAIACMRRGARWPRAGYLQLPVAADLLAALRAYSSAEALVCALATCPPNEELIAELARRLSRSRPDLSHLVAALAMTDEAILQSWEKNRVTAANHGTWMHWLFEAHLNGVMVPACPEFTLLQGFLRQCSGLTAYRTEWQILRTRSGWQVPLISWQSMGLGGCTSSTGSVRRCSPPSTPPGSKGFCLHLITCLTAPVFIIGFSSIVIATSWSGTTGSRWLR